MPALINTSRNDSRTWPPINWPKPRLQNSIPFSKVRRAGPWYYTPQEHRRLAIRITSYHTSLVGIKMLWTIFIPWYLEQYIQAVEVLGRAIVQLVVHVHKRPERLFPKSINPLVTSRSIVWFLADGGPHRLKEHICDDPHNHIWGFRLLSYQWQVQNFVSQYLFVSYIWIVLLKIQPNLLCFGH